MMQQNIQKIERKMCKLDDEIRNPYESKAMRFMGSSQSREPD